MSKPYLEALAASPLQTEKGEVIEPTTTYNAVFRTITEDSPNYRNVGWIGSSVLIMKTQLGLGMLSIPAAFNTLGIVPGVICLLAIAGLITYASYIIGGFKLNHPKVYRIDDIAAIIFGPIGRELFSLGFILFLVFAAGSGMLGISIGLNAVSTHGACTAVFVAVAAITVFCFASIRTLGRITILAWVGLAAIVVAILAVTIAVGVQDRPDLAPEGPWESDYRIVAHPSFTEGITAVSTFIFAYAGTPFYFPIVAEMRDHRHFTKALLLCQTAITLVYLVIGIVVYYYCGSYVASPALGSAGSLIKKISYGIALPGLLASSTLSTHLSSKHIFVRILRGSKHLSANTFVHWATWLGCVSGVAVTAYCIASGIPVFGGLVSLIGALFGTLMCFQPLGGMWFYDNWKGNERRGSSKWYLLVALNASLIIVGTFLTIAGTYGTIVGIIDSYKADGGSKAWACADNSNSV
ncbi:transmembrane amino acid transporter protein-domain-containing protein [Ilyonectria destructans]|nr:transmembrane amino acid transporter protein-domain-containing protein [Ilyonectria destructans]